MKKVQKPRKPLIVYYLIALGVLIVINFVLFPMMMNGNIEEVDYGTFLTMVEEKQVSKVQLEGETIYFTDKSDTPQQYETTRFEDPDLVNRLRESGCEFGRVAEEQMNPFLSMLLSLVIPIVVFVIIGQILSRQLMKKMGGGTDGGPFMQFGKSTAKMYVQSETGITFNDVAGEDEAKELLTEIVDFLHNPQKYQEIGAICPKGALLVGPPGTGKTLLAKAVAGEAGVPFFSISGSEFVEMFVGMGASKVRDLFKQANEKAPCIVFIDEIDTVGKKRDAQGYAGNDEREQTLNQLLTEMDGFDTSKGVVILGACNRPDSLDPALLRPGRIDRRIQVELPDYIGREAILRVHARKVRLGECVDLKAIARMTPGASGADLANMINEAALRAVREGRQYVIQEDLEESIETVLAGYKKKNPILTEKEKRMVSYHEIGHAMIAALIDHKAPVTKITIIPRTSGTLGYTMQADEEERHLITKTEMKDRIAVITGGRAAEQVIFGEITSGAANDIEEATKLARAMIAKYGMSDTIGMVSMEHTENIYLGGESYLQCSEALAEEIDRQVIALVKEQQQRAEKILQENIEKLNRLAEYLYREETITGETFTELMGNM